MNSREAPGDDGCATQESWRKRGVLAAAAFAIVGVANDHPLPALRSVVSGNLGDGLVASTRQDVQPLARLPVNALVAPRNMFSLNFSRCPR